MTNETTTRITAVAGKGLQICCGSTSPTSWKNYGDGIGIDVNIDTSSCGFTKTPLYFTSLGGTSMQWETTGATSIYEQTEKGFRIYVRWSDGRKLTRKEAIDYEWHILGCH